LQIPIPGGNDKSLSLTRRYTQALGEPLGYLLGGPALAALYLLDGVFGAADALRQVELGKVKLFAALPEPAAK
jgi:hypothetical protein